MHDDGGDRGEGDSAAGARETRRQGRGRLDDRGEGAFGACGSGPNILILRFRHPAHAQNIVVSNHPELTQVFSTFSPRSQLTRNSKVCRVLSTFSPSSGGSSASNLLEPSPCVEFLPLQLPTTVSFKCGKYLHCNLHVFTGILLFARKYTG